MNGEEPKADCGNRHSELVGWEGIALVGKWFTFQLSKSLILLCPYECVRLLHNVKDGLGGDITLF